ADANLPILVFTDAGVTKHGGSRPIRHLSGGAATGNRRGGSRGQVAALLGTVVVVACSGLFVRRNGVGLPQQYRSRPTADRYLLFAVHCSTSLQLTWILTWWPASLFPLPTTRRRYLNAHPPCRAYLCVLD